MTLSPTRAMTAYSPLVHPASSQAQYRAHLFGLFNVSRNDQPLGEPVWRRNKAKTLLKWFLLNPGKCFSIAQLSQLCWPDVPQETAVKNLHVTMHYLRHLLEPELSPGQRSTFIRRNRHNFYWFDLDEHWWVDLLEVERLSSVAREADRRSDFTTALASYRSLLDYYTLGFLPEEVYEDIFTPYRRKYDCAYTQTLERLMQLCTQENMFDDVLTYALQALSVDPYNESAIGAMANVYLKWGNSARAIHTLDRFQSFLKQELGIVPTKELQVLRENILQSL